MDDARCVYDEVCGCECSMFDVVCDVRALFDDGSVVVLPAKDKGLPLFCPEVSGMVRPCREKLAAFWPSLCLRPSNHLQPQLTVSFWILGSFRKQ